MLQEQIESLKARLILYARLVEDMIERSIKAFGARQAEVLEVQSGQFADPEAGGVEELKEGPIAQAGNAVLGGKVEEGRRLRFGQERRHGPVLFRAG